jgi:hypothetical protein
MVPESARFHNSLEDSYVIGGLISPLHGADRPPAARLRHIHVWELLALRRPFPAQSVEGVVR